MEIIVKGFDQGSFAVGFLTATLTCIVSLGIIIWRVKK